MDQFERPSQRRLLEKTVQRRLSMAEHDRDKARLMGYTDDATGIRRSLLVVVAVVLLVILAFLVVGAIAGPSEPSVEELQPAWGTVTHDETLVQPAPWWSTEPERPD